MTRNRYKCIGAYKSYNIVYADLSILARSIDEEKNIYYRNTRDAFPKKKRILKDKTEKLSTVWKLKRAHTTKRKHPEKK